MKVFIASFLILTFEFAANANTTVPSSAVVVTPEAVADANVASSLYFYSGEKLKYLGFLVNDTVVFVKKITTKHEHEYAAVYKTREAFKLADIKTIEAHAESLDSGVKWVQKLSTVDLVNGGLSVVEKLHPVPSDYAFRNVALIDENPVSTVVAGNVSEAGGSEAATFMNLLNNYRAQMGRRPLAHVPGMAFDDNAGHSVFRSSGMSGVSNWAGSRNAHGAFQMWRNSPGHNANMLNGGLSRGDVSFGPGGATFVGQ